MTIYHNCFTKFICEIGDVMETGQPELEVYDMKDIWKTRLKELALF